MVRSAAELGEDVVVVDGGAQSLEERGDDRRVDLQGDAPQVEAVQHAATDGAPGVVPRRRVDTECCEPFEVVTEELLLGATAIGNRDRRRYVVAHVEVPGA